jgi:hypothetical protein
MLARASIAFARFAVLAGAYIRFMRPNRRFEGTADRRDFFSSRVAAAAPQADR